MAEKQSSLPCVFASLRLCVKGLASVWLFVCIGLASAQTIGKDPVSVTVSAPPSVRRGEAFRIEVRFAVQPPYHVYGPNETKGSPTRVEPQPAAGVSFGAPEYPAPEEKDFESAGGRVAVYEGEFAVAVPATVAADAAPGPRTLSFKVAYGACTDKICLRAQRRAVEAALVIADGAPAGGTGAAPALPGSTSNPLPSVTPAPAPAPPPAGPDGGGTPLGRTMVEFLWACVLGGLVSLIMPCVYPLLPITMTYFVKQSGGSRLQSVGLAGAYALGLIVSFTGLGIGLSLLLGAGGAVRFAANPWVNLAVAGVFLGFALSMFGLFDLTLPGSWTGALMSGSRKGFGGAFVLGVSFSVITFTCTMPVASALLALAAGGSAGQAVSGMLVYSATMALPFFVLGVSPGLLKSVPRSGGWLVAAKIGMGFLEIMLVVYYLSKSDWGWGWGVLTREGVLGLWLAASACAAAYFFGGFQVRGHAEEGRIGAGRVATGLAALALAGVFVAGLPGRHLGPLEPLLPIARSAGGDSGRAPDDDFDRAAQDAKAAGKPLFVEFTGFT